MTGMGVMEFLFSGFFLVAGVGTAVYAVYAVVVEVLDYRALRRARRRILREHHDELLRRPAAE